MNRLLTLACTCAAIGVSASSFAQDENPFKVLTGTTARIGYVAPLNKSLSDIKGYFGGVGLDLNFPTGLIKHMDTFGSIEYVAQSLGGSGATMVPITINERRYLGPVKDPSNKYVFAGLGYDIQHFKSNTSAFIGRLGYGFDISDRTCAEAAVILAKKNGDGVTANRLGLYIGIRL